MHTTPTPPPKVTVLLSSFNHAPFLRDAIDSVLGQTFADFELIILDDASSDASWTIIESYDDPRIRAFRNAAPLGPVANANRALSELARGAYIAIHHSDDAWAPDKLAQQCAALDADPALGAVFTWVQIIDETSRELDNDWFNQPPRDRWKLLHQLFNEENHLAHPSAMLRHECYRRSGLYHPGLVQTPDADMWFRLLVDWPVRIIPAKLTFHRIHTKGSNTSSSLRPEVHLRTATEWNQLRRHLLRLPDADAVLSAFPELEACCPRAREADVKFLLALACLHCSHKRGAWALGFELLFELLNDARSAHALGERHAFDWRSLAALTGRHDVFGNADVQRLEQMDHALQQGAIELDRLRGENDRLRAELDAAQSHAATAEDALTQARTQAERLQARLERITGNPIYRALAAVHRQIRKISPKP